MYYYNAYNVISPRDAHACVDKNLEFFPLFHHTQIRDIYCLPDDSESLFQSSGTQKIRIKFEYQYRVVISYQYCTQSTSIQYIKLYSWQIVVLWRTKTTVGVFTVESVNLHMYVSTYVPVRGIYSFPSVVFILHPFILGRLISNFYPRQSFRQFYL